MKQSTLHGKFRLAMGCIVLFSLAVFAQWQGKGKMRGMVTDEKGAPIPDVKVKVYSTAGQAGFETKTEKDGSWKALWIRGGNWDIDFSKMGYEPKRISVNIMETGKMSDIPIQLKKIEGVMLTKELMDELEKGNELFRNGKYDEALAEFQKMIVDNPDAYIIHTNIGNCYFEKKEYDKAVESYQKVLTPAPDDVNAKISIGNCFSNKGDMKSALEWYKKVDIQKLNDSDVLYNIGIFFFNSSDLANATLYLNRAVEVKPDNLDALFQLGVTWISAGKYPEAKAVFEKYLAIDPTSARAEQIKEILKGLK